MSATDEKVARLEQLLEQAKATIEQMLDPRPFHQHTCLDAPGAIAHTWTCHSPYCDMPKIAQPCPSHGGETPRGM